MIPRIKKWCGWWECRSTNAYSTGSTPSAALRSWTALHNQQRRAL